MSYRDGGRIDVGVVIPTIGTEGYVYRLISDLVRQDYHTDIYVYVNLPEGSVIGDQLMAINYPHVQVEQAPEHNIHHMWNMGVGECAAVGHTYVVILNDDIEIGENFIEELIKPMTEDEDIWVTSANWDGREFDGDYMYFPGTRKDNGLCGFAFAVRMEAFIDGLPDFDEKYNVHYGDDDLYRMVAYMGKKAVMAKRAYVNHIGGGSQSFGDRSRYVNDENTKDRIYHEKKWANIETFMEDWKWITE